jgi:DNA invertase Pin-like site-specific DNA recombinase
MAGVSAVFAQLERELIAQRTAEALDELRNHGRVYGPVPFGYDAVDGLLVASPGEQVVLDFMQAMRRGGASYVRIDEGGSMRSSRTGAATSPARCPTRWRSKRDTAWAMPQESLEGFIRRPFIAEPAHAETAPL